MDNVVDFKRKAYEEMLAWKGTLAGKTALLSFVPRTLVKKGALHICHFT